MADWTEREALKRHGVLDELQRQYLQMVPIRCIDFKSVFTSLRCPHHKDILQKTYLSPLSRNYAPSVSYQRQFLRCVLQHSEEFCDDVDEWLYEVYADVVSKAEESSTICYKSYILSPGSVITLEESQQIISHGTTGLSTWQASMFLSEWAVEHHTMFQDRNIIELGCGVGLLGLTITSCSSPSHYVFTDCHELVLDKLKTNLSINGFTSAGNKCQCHSGTALNSSGNVMENKPSNESPCPKFGVPKSRIPGARWIRNINHVGVKNDSTQASKIKDSLDANNLCGSCGCTCSITKVDGIKYNLDANNLYGSCGCTGIGREDVWLNKERRTSGHDSCINMSTHRLESIGIEAEKDHCCVIQQDKCNTTSGLLKQNSVEQSDYFEDKTHNEFDPEDISHERGGHLNSTRNVALAKLDWENVADQDLEDLSAGIILATDVIYDVEIIKPLVNVLRILLSCPGDGRGKPIALMASTIRNPDTYQAFLDELGKQDITWSGVPKASLRLFFYDRESEIALIKLETAGVD